MCFTNLFRKWFRIEGKGRRLERRNAFRKGYRTAKRIFADLGETASTEPEEV
jgi:hypothetical protein